MNWHGHEKTIDIDDLVARVDECVGGGAVAVALADLDRFGELNEYKGRDAGNRVLEVWIETLTQSLPSDRDRRPSRGRRVHRHATERLGGTH